MPVILVPGNHERSSLPFPLLAAHENLHVLDVPSTVVVERGGLRVAFAGFPYARSVRSAFPWLLAATGHRRAEADARVLCLHQCVEGATCGPPPGFTFRDGDDVVRASDLPDDVAAVLCGHVHRQQVLRRDLRGRPLGAPVVYAGSVERTSFAEREEVKGFVLATVGPGGRGGRLLALERRALATRPMRVLDLTGTDAGSLEARLRGALADAPPDVVLQVRVPERLAGAEALRASRLRALGTPTANVTLAVVGADRRARSRVSRHDAAVRPPRGSIPMNRRLLALALGLAGAAHPAAAGSVEGLLRQRADAFVAAVNANDPATLSAFAEQHLATRVAREGLAARFVDGMRAEHEELGRVERYSTQVLRDGALVFVYCKRAKSGAWQNYQFRVLAEDGHRLQLVFRAIAAEPVEPSSAPLGSAEAERWMARFEAKLEAEQPFSGVAVARSRGREVHAVVRGVADASRNLPVTRQSRFGMASGSKMFTSVAILQLAQAGKLQLDDTLAKHLPDFPDGAFARRATLHQLLTHTAGAGNYWDDAYEKEWGRITELGQMIPFVVKHLGDSPPGAFAYSNSGYLLLGLVIEAASGSSYYDYVAKHVLGPAEMRATGFPVRGDSTPDVALPYEPEMDAGAVKAGVYVPALLGARGTSAGGASTTVDDLLRFVDALLSGRLLDAKHLMTRGHVPYGEAKDAWYGYGTIVERTGGVLSWGHGGMAPGTQFELKVFPDRDAALVVMSNYNTIAGPEIASALDHLARNPER